MPPIVIAAGIAAAGAIGGAAISSNASEHAADTTTAAANHAADVQAQSAKDALAFQEAKAQNQAQNDAINREANYRLMAAKAAKYGSLGQLLGLGGVSVPDYVPGVMPNFTGGPSPTPGPVNSPMTAPSPAPAPQTVDPRLMGGNTGVIGGVPGLELQPDGTYKLASSLPRVGSVGSYLS